MLLLTRRQGRGLRSFCPTRSSLETSVRDPRLVASYSPGPRHRHCHWSRGGLGHATKIRVGLPLQRGFRGRVHHAFLPLRVLCLVGRDRDAVPDAGTAGTSAPHKAPRYARQRWTNHGAAVNWSELFASHHNLLSRLMHRWLGAPTRKPSTPATRLDAESAAHAVFISSTVVKSSGPRALKLRVLSEPLG